MAKELGLDKDGQQKHLHPIDYLTVSYITDGIHMIASLFHTLLIASIRLSY